MNGRYGPYVTCNGESRSLPPNLSPLDITLPEAVHLLKQPKSFGKKSSSAALKTLGTSPVTNKPIVLRSGRHGPYVNDGETNASIPKGTDPDGITVDEALALLAARATAPARRGSRRRFTKKARATSPPKPATAKKAAKRKATKKKARP